jgi:hypothetical protein
LVASGSDTRQRRTTLTARFNDQEAEAIRQMADRAGVPVASYLRAAALNRVPARAVRRPTVSHETAARLLGNLGRIAETLRVAAQAGQFDPAEPTVAAALRDIAEMRTVCFEAMGREP